MDTNAMMISMVSMGGLGILFSAGLSIANKVFHVEEDPRIGRIQDELPGANCGGCGLPGCGAFAEALVAGKIELNGCPVSTEDAVQEIADIMGIEAGTSEKLIARVMCRGGNYETAPKGDYTGVKTCIGAQISGGGDKMCDHGCLGFADCVNSCPFDAMYMNSNGLPAVIEELCTGCGNCVDSCPRDVIELHAESHKLFVLCRNHDDPKEARKVCTAACIGCGICVRAVDEGQIVIKENLAEINYEIYGKEAIVPTDKCSTNCLCTAESILSTEDQEAA